MLINSKNNRSSKIITIRPRDEIMTRQGIPYLMGITGHSAGARGLSMSMVIIPPGGAALPHLHRGFETAIYILEGRVETRFGEGLKDSIINEAGDFLYIPEDCPHQPVNLSKTKSVKAIVARTDANEQESVVLYKDH
ncbi:MAG: cupin domain-containing protein [Calditrichaeota bacterium]|nr:cupin domain-containing protein [Calditrichota bacterium]RQV92506.1 MAG: cupin domain-containing protein [bacterium]RQV99362.1 MAG: cupin domain-containing protein [Calditrichota bacterium]